MKKIREIYEPYMLRPVIYMTFTRFILALFITLLADFFISQGGRSVKSNAFLLCAAIFGLLSGIAWLRLDGARLPKLMMLRINPSKKPSRMYGDMIDYIEESPGIGFDELDDKEKDVCILAADLFCFIVFLITALLI